MWSTHSLCVCWEVTRGKHNGLCSALSEQQTDSWQCLCWVAVAGLPPPTHGPVEVMVMVGIQWKLDNNLPIVWVVWAIGWLVPCVWGLCPPYHYRACPALAEPLLARVSPLYNTYGGEALNWILWRASCIWTNHFYIGKYSSKGFLSIITQW